VRLERKCEDIQIELSARLDGVGDEDVSPIVDEHVRDCAVCRVHRDRLIQVRRALRAQTTEQVPDLTQEIMTRLEPRRSRLQNLTAPARIAGVAAVAAALLIAGTTWPWGERSPDPARAGNISREVRAAAGSLSSYRARFEITERGWHPQVKRRHFSARVMFDAPESFRLHIGDDTAYPEPWLWPANDIDVIANAHRWWIREPLACPPASLPQCGIGGDAERTVVHRQPFDGTSSLPTDIIVPLETLASSSGFDTIGREDVIGRAAYHVRLPYRQAIPLVTALQEGGSWRPFRPSDQVDLWLDEQTWFPLRFQVTRDGGSKPLLDVVATSFAAGVDIDSSVFSAPRRGIVRTGGFHELPLPSDKPPWAPLDTEHLRPYRWGTTTLGQKVLVYARGMTWLKAVHEQRRACNLAYEPRTEIVNLSRGGVGYYQPAGLTAKRRLDIFGTKEHLALESNLSRAQLITVAESIPLESHPLEESSCGGGPLSITRVGSSAIPSLRFAQRPSYLPPGYSLGSAFLSKHGDESTTLRLYYRRVEAEYDDFGVRITQSPTVDFLPPSFEDHRAVDIGEGGRWSRERRELEWMQDGVYRAVAAPSFNLRTVLEIARGLR
jgi:outer membrane lipoprotein-sorting protein